MKEEWEIHQDHDFDFVTAQCRSLGLPEPTKTEGGFIHNVKKEILFRRFKGAEFHKIFTELGHDSCDFERCKCRRNQ